MKEQDAWNKIAPEWAEYRTKTETDIIDFLKGKKGRILDIGCGSGRNMMKQEGLTWNGIDFSQKMIEKAQKNTDTKGVEANLRVGEAENLPYKNESFDYAISNAVLHCIQGAKQRKTAIKEIHRILKQGGEAYISVWSGNHPKIQKKLEGTKEGIMKWGDIPRYTYIYEKKELEEACKQAGLEIEKSFEDKNITMIVKKPSSPHHTFARAHHPSPARLQRANP